MVISLPKDTSLAKLSWRSNQWFSCEVANREVDKQMDRLMLGKHISDAAWNISLGRGNYHILLLLTRQILVSHYVPVLILVTVSVLFFFFQRTESGRWCNYSVTICIFVMMIALLFKSCKVHGWESNCLVGPKVVTSLTCLPYAILSYCAREIGLVTR